MVVKVGWTKPTDPLTSWDDDTIKAIDFNSRVSNAIFSVVTNEEFKKISSTKSANEARITLQNTYDGTKAIKDSKFQRLNTSFEEIRIDDN